jgi:5'-AMP-activated protein kinase, catalytic alpha subunit
VAFHE